MTTSGHSALLSTEKVERRGAYPLSSEQATQIKSHWDDELDQYNGEVPDVYFKWDWPTFIRPKRRLLREQAYEVQRFINAIVRRNFPFQIREYMGRQYWIEFCEYYAVNPDYIAAMRLL